LFHHDLLSNTATNGWAEYQSNTGERIFGIHPKLIGIFVDAIIAGVFPDPEIMSQASAASGVAQENTDQAAVRARGVASRLIRDAKFSKEVREAYNESCAMCGLSIGLVVGAHIFPVSAPGAPDAVWNGLALCHNHHSAFDKHYIWIDPVSHDVKMKPDILDFATTDAAAKTFTDNTGTRLVTPSSTAKRPRANMFTSRYEHFNGCYDWA
jgi:hypothetical protein